MTTMKKWKVQSGKGFANNHPSDVNPEYTLSFERGGVATTLISINVALRNAAKFWSFNCF